MPQDLIQIADRFFSAYARVSRADKTGAVECICCNHTFHWLLTDCGHFVTRGHMGLRYDLDNCWPVCRTCHSKPEHSAEYEAGLIKKKGEGFVANLRTRGNQYFRARTRKEMEALIEEIVKKLREYDSKQEAI